MVWNFLLLTMLTALPLNASAQVPAFKDKSVRVIVGLPPGGGSDPEERVIARHLGKYLPGNPSLIVQNMPGAGGIIAFNYFADLAKPDGEPWTAYVTWAGSDAAGRPLLAPRKTPQPIVQTLRAAFDKLANDKQFMSDLRNVGGEDAEMISAAKIQPLVQQLLVISPGVRDFTKKITAKHLQR